VVTNLPKATAPKISDGSKTDTRPAQSPEPAHTDANQPPSVERTDREQPAPPAGERNDEEQPTETLEAGVVIHPYDLAKNAFSHQGKQVLLDAGSLPVLVNGAIYTYSQGEGFPGPGLRLERMLSENQALYEIMSLDAQGGSEPSHLGEMIVILPTDGPRSLEVGNEWVVEPLGLAKGTNAFGGPISVPLVRFVRYWDPDPREPPPQQEFTTHGRTEATCVYCPQAQFSDEAVRAGVQGIVVLKITVLPDGMVGTNIEIIKGIGYGLDEKAVEAVRSWRLKPATGPDGKPTTGTMIANFVFHKH
jgi:TonB family protein